jgi:RNA polymerase sigma-70 factor (ECF subfamily)
MEWVTTTTILDRLNNAADGSAWSSFLDRFRIPVVSFSQKLGLNRADAEDVAQETLLAFLEAYRRKTYERGRGRLSHYLFGIAHNKILLARRKIATQERQVDSGDDGTGFWSALSDSGRLEDVWEREWREAVLTQCLDQIREEVSFQTFEAFRLVVFKQMQPAAVAQELGMTRNAVFIAKHRVANRVRELSALWEEDR